VLAEAPHVILATAGNAGVLLPDAPLPLTPVRGQVTFAPPGPRLDVPVGGDGFVVPSAGGFVLGATFQLDDPESEPRLADHASNLKEIARLLAAGRGGACGKTLTFVDNCLGFAT
jgi:tRNA 5-methylaminomethyl-2-thiouridine biosynthesis bifunctional protein